MRNLYCSQRTIRLRKAPQDPSRRLWGQLGAVDYTSALQVGKGYSRVAFQLQKFNPLFTLVFTQITAMKFTVFGNILSNIANIESHWKNFALSFDSVTRLLLRVFPNTVNSIAMIWVKTNVNRGLNFCSCNATLVMT